MTGFPAEPIDRRRRYERVADRLIALIAQRALEPGAPLPIERELSETFGVGRSSVREALRMLESQGVIGPGPGGGFTVAAPARPLQRSLRLVMTLQPSPAARDLFELRRILEVEAAGLAAERRSPADVARMDAAIAAMAERLAPDRAGAFVDADVEFHLALASSTGNQLLGHAMDAIRDVLRSALLPVFGIPHSAERAVAEHRAIRDAVADGDAAAARRAARAHLERVEVDLGAARPGADPGAAP
jgi:GntR family transcriptional repressor for pyruvate dehydrogenase complex